MILERYRETPNPVKKQVNETGERNRCTMPVTRISPSREFRRSVKDAFQLAPEPGQNPFEHTPDPLFHGAAMNRAQP